MNEYSKHPGRIPERWLHCPQKANDLLVNKFLAFKTPLGEKFNPQVPAECRFTPSMFFESVNNSKTKLGYWIDLTRSKRFYDQDEIRSNDCKYLKIECHGHEGAPTKDQKDLFVAICRKFISKDPLSVIGVHCTHGFNRTGFMLVSFLVEEFSFSVEAAISEFARVRPPGIYKEQYLQELFKCYCDDTDNAVPRVPPLPSWCFHEDGDDDVTLTRKNGGGGGKKRDAKYVDNPTFMDGVPGVEALLDRDEINRIRQEVKRLTNNSLDSFNGSQPVSMDQSNIQLLTDKPYRVSWKADGTRYMMFIANRDEIYFLDRNHSVFMVRRLQFFSRRFHPQHLSNTLLDGEMVIDVFGDKQIPRYLVYDIVYSDGHNVGAQPFFPVRLRAIETDIVEPRINAMKDGRIQKECEPFSVRAKPFYEISMAGDLLGKKFSKQLTHAPDGLIFQPSNDPYVYGTASAVLKWKPESLNSIDFRLRIERREDHGCLPEFDGVLLTGNGRKFGVIRNCKRPLRAFDGKIIECKYENHKWVFMRERTDKSFPNSDRTAEAVFKSICHPISKQMLLDYIREHGRKNPMAPPAGPPPVKRPRTSLTSQ